MITGWSIWRARGGQWINTNLIPSSPNAVTDLGVAITEDYVYADGSYFFGVWGDSGFQRMSIGLNAENTLRYGDGGAFYTVAGNWGGVNVFHHIRYGQRVLMLDRVDLGKTPPLGKPFQFPIALFGRKTANGCGGNKVGIRISYFRLYVDDALVLDLIPVVKNNIGYMYDRISGELFGNEGTGEFIVGPKVSEQKRRLPIGYKELKWVESTGEQYIDLDYLTSSELEVKMRVAVSEYTTSEFDFISNQSGANGSRRRFIVCVHNGKYCACLRNSDNAQNKNIYSTADYTSNTFNNVGLVVSPSNSKASLLVNGESFETEWSTDVANSVSKMRLFAGYTSSLKPSYYLEGKISAATIKGDGETLFDLIPCLSPSGEAGMYDLVEGKFYGSETETPLVAGDLVDVASRVPVGYTEIETLDTNGRKCYVDSPVTSKLGVPVVFKTKCRWNRIIENYASSNGCGNQPRWGITASGNWTDSGLSGKPSVDVWYDIVTPNITKTSTGNVGVTLNLFCAHRTSDRVNFSDMAIKDYYAIYEDGALVYCGIPCMNPEGTEGLWDIVGKQFWPLVVVGSFDE